MDGPYSAVAVKNSMFGVAVYYAVEAPGADAVGGGTRVVVQRFNTADAADGCAQLLNEAFAAGRRSVALKDFTGDLFGHGVIGKDAPGKAPIEPVPMPAGTAKKGSRRKEAKESHGT